MRRKARRRRSSTSKQGHHRLIGVDANANVSGNQAFTIVEGFTGQAGELIIVFEKDENETYIRGDVNGDSQIDLQIELEGHHLGFDNLVL